MFRFIFENPDNMKYKQSIAIFFDIAGYILFSFLILKQKLFKHNYVSMGIIGLILLILFIISIFNTDTEVIWKCSLYYFFYSVCFDLYDVLKKKYMILFLNTPYFMMLVIGIVDVILILIVDFIIYLIDNDTEGIILGLKLNITTVGAFFLMLLDLIIQFIWNLGIWLTIYYLTPCHYFICEYISEYMYSKQFN